MSWHFAHDFFYVIFLFAIILVACECAFNVAICKTNRIHLIVSVCFVFAFLTHSLRFDLVFKYAYSTRYIRMTRCMLYYGFVLLFLLCLLFIFHFSFLYFIAGFCFFLRTCALWSFCGGWCVESNCSHIFILKLWLSRNSCVTIGIFYFCKNYNEGMRLHAVNAACVFFSLLYFCLHRMEMTVFTHNYYARNAV